MLLVQVIISVRRPTSQRKSRGSSLLVKWTNSFPHLLISAVLIVTYSQTQTPPEGYLKATGVIQVLVLDSIIVVQAKKGSEFIGHKRLIIEMYLHGVILAAK